MSCRVSDLRPSGSEAAATQDAFIFDAHQNSRVSKNLPLFSMKLATHAASILTCRSGTSDIF